MINELESTGKYSADYWKSIVYPDSYSSSNSENSKPNQKNGTLQEPVRPVLLSGPLLEQHLSVSPHSSPDLCSHYSNNNCEFSSHYSNNNGEPIDNSRRVQSSPSDTGELMPFDCSNNHVLSMAKIDTPRSRDRCHRYRASAPIQTSTESSSSQGPTHDGVRRDSDMEAVAVRPSIRSRSVSPNKEFGVLKLLEQPTVSADGLVPSDVTPPTDRPPDLHTNPSYRPHTHRTRKCKTLNLPIISDVGSEPLPQRILQPANMFLEWWTAIRSPDKCCHDIARLYQPSRLDLSRQNARPQPLRLFA